MDREKAIEKFIEHVRDAEEYLEKIQDYLGEHMERDPESLTWGDTGDAARLKNMLEEICETFNL